MNVIARAALVLGCFGVVGLASGCGAPAETDTLAKKDPALIVINPIFFEPPLLSQVTGTPADNGATCGDTTVAPPTSMAGFNCSYGTAITTDPEGMAYAWACQPVSSTGEAIIDAIVAVENAADESTAFGGPTLTSNPPLDTYEINTTTYTDTCYGPADSGYVILSVQYKDRTRRPSPGCGDDCSTGGTGSGSGGGDIGSGSGGIIVGGPILKI